MPTVKYLDLAMPFDPSDAFHGQNHAEPSANQRVPLAYNDLVRPRTSAKSLAESGRFVWVTRSGAQQMRVPSIPKRPV